MRKLVIGDIHGAFKALMQTLKRANYDPDNDELIVLGDVVDGWPDVCECICFLNAQPNIKYVLGNHDEWAWDFVEYGRSHDMWLNQGGQATMESFIRQSDLIGGSKAYTLVRSFFRKSVYFYKDEDNRVYVHGGFPSYSRVENTHKDQLMWDREMTNEALRSDENITDYENVFIGHTTTQFFDGQNREIISVDEGKGVSPIIANEVINLDTGAGWGGKLTIMDAETKEYWQSDFVKTLYPEVKGRE